MREDQIGFNKADDKKELKKYRAQIRMVHEEVLSDYHDSIISFKDRYQCEYPAKEMIKIVDGSDIYDVIMIFFTY